MKKTYAIEVDCANCANAMEVAANKVPGVEHTVVNFMTQRMTVELAEGQQEQEVMQQVLKACRKIERHCRIEF